jgi:Rrf2 family protein
MQITRETDYAISCILFMAIDPERTYAVAEIAKPHYIPESFLAKILQKLVKAGFVKSTRGMKGGFLLAKKPKEISLLDVVETIEGAITINTCAADADKCSMSDTCPVYPVWVEVKNGVEERLKQYDFETLVTGKSYMTKGVIDSQ